MRNSTALPRGVAQRVFRYSASDWRAWIDAKPKWLETGDPGVWGRFQAQASSGRYLFTHRDGQSHYHFGETLVGASLEAEGYKCWTTARIMRRRSVRKYATQTAEVEALLRETVGRVPQEEYVKRRDAEGLHLKTVDLVGYHAGRRRWAFCEVKRQTDRLMPEQIDTLAFLRGLYPQARAEVFVASVLTET
jgi:hypothetical protein